MLNSVKWEYFKLEDLFDVKISKSLNKNQLTEKSANENNNIKYITRSSINNGFDGFYLNNHDESYVNNGNCISVAMVGESLTSFYQKDDFITSQNIAIIRKVSLNMYHYLFLIPIIEMDMYRYSYGRTLNLRHLKNTSIKLPIDSNGDPNWEFMEDYMKKISKGNLEGFNLPKNDTRLRLDEREWDEFKLEDLFEVYSSTNLTTNISEKMSKGNVFHVIRSHENNMTTDKKLSKKELEDRKIKINSGNKIVVGAESFSLSYQANSFVVGRGVSILKNKNLNKYNSLFVISVIRKNSYRCSYGRAYYAGRLKSTIIKLPIKPKSSPEEKSEPDWEFMENYIKGLPYTNKL